MKASGLIERHHEADGVTSSAIYSKCERYRYALTRGWNSSGPRLLYVMLNPSKATEAQNDPTIERCERRARALGFGAFRATNLFAWRETDPARLRKAPQPVGPANDRMILASLENWLRDSSDLALCSWGVHGTLHGRAHDVALLMIGTGRPLSCLGTTRDGHPRHPLYVAYATSPVTWAPSFVNH
jgi:hypothetical protein